MSDILKEFFDYILLEKGLSKNSALSYKADLEDYKKFLGKKNILDSNKEDLYKYLKNLKERYKESSYVRKFSSLRAFYKYLELNFYLKENPIYSLEKVKSAKRIPQYLEQEEILKIIESIDNSIFGVRDRLILDFLIFTGGRISEILNLKISDIDYSNSTIRIIGKGNKTRIIPALKFIMDKISHYNDNFRKKLVKKSSEEFNLFPNISRNNFWYRISNYAKKAGLNKKVYPHIFRHSLATTMLNNGANLRYVQELLGHSSIKTTEIYTHISKKKLKEIYDNAFED